MISVKNEYTDEPSNESNPQINDSKISNKPFFNDFIEDEKKAFFDDYDKDEND